MDSVCVGCGFYRPDPSYLLAIEGHLNSLRADRETAIALEVDDEMTAAIQSALIQAGLAPREHLVDAGYINAQSLTPSAATGPRPVHPPGNRRPSPRRAASAGAARAAGPE